MRCWESAVIAYQDFIDNMGEETGIKELGGAYVSSVVEGGSASEAGIRKGDVILDIDGGGRSTTMRRSPGADRIAADPTIRLNYR